MGNKEKDYRKNGKISGRKNKKITKINGILKGNSI